MFLRGGSSRSNTIDESSRRRFDVSARSMNDFAGTSSAEASATIPEGPPMAPTARSGGTSWGSQRFFRRGQGSQAALLRNNNKKRLAQPSPKSSQSLSLSTTSHTTSSPTTSNYSRSCYGATLISPGLEAFGFGAPLSSPSPSTSSPAKKKQTRNLSDNSNSNSNNHDHHGVPRIIVAGPPLVGSGGSNNGGNSNASNSSSRGSSAPRRPAAAASPASRPHIYVPHLDDTVSSFDGRGGKGHGSTAAAATPMDYCHHNSSNATRRNPLPPPPYVVSGPAPSSAPRRLPSDEDWTPSAAPRHPHHHPHPPSRRCDDEDTDIHDGETYNDYDHDDGRSASLCDTLHNSLGGNDSFRLPRLRASTSTSNVSGVFCCEDSYHNYSSSAGTDSFRLPNPYSVCDDSLHNSSSMGTESHRRRHRHHQALDDDEYDVEDLQGPRGQLHGDERTTTATQGSTTSGSARVVEEDQEERQDDKPVGGGPDDNSDEVSLSPEEAVEVTRETRSSAENSRASTTATTSATSANASRRSAGPTAADSLSASSIIEIFPGCKVPLRGCKDTWGSFRDGTAVLVPCAACLSCVYCVPDVTMVLCPHCRDISPLATTVDNRHSEASVGLGMSVHESRSMLGS